MNKEETIKDIQNIINANCGTISEQSAKSIAEALYNAGYRKVPDNAVILTPEERDEELKACNEKQAELENEITRLNNIEVELQELNMKYYNEAKDLRRELAEAKAENEKLKKMNDIAHVLLGQAIRHIDVDEQLDRYMQASKEGAQEFAKKLKERLMQDRVTNDNVVIVTGVLIDELLKEYEK